MLNNQGAGTGASDDTDRFLYEYHFTGLPYVRSTGRKTWRSASKWLLTYKDREDELGRGSSTVCGEF
jgi:hypothetical protein